MGLIHLSLLFATIQPLLIIVSSDACQDYRINEHNLTTAKWIWKLECCTINSQHFTLEIKAQTGSCMSNNCSDRYFDTKCQKGIYLSYCLIVGNGSINVSYEDSASCRGYDNTSGCDPKVTSSQCINFTSGENRSISWTSRNPQNIKIKFKCAPGTHRILHKEAKSWIDALEHCQQENSSLFEITNQMENNILYRLYDFWNDLKNGAWIGLEKSIFGKNPNWTWISKPKNNSFQCNISLPANHSYHCGKIILVNSTMNLQGNNCHEKLPYICKSSTEQCSTTVTPEFVIDFEARCNKASQQDECN